MTTQNSYSIFFKSANIANDLEAMTKWSERYPNFTPSEIACRRSGDLLINYEAMAALQSLRTMWRRPMHIGSGYRSPAHNVAVGGAKDSLHMQGRAYDVLMKGHSDASVVSFLFYAVNAGFRGFGMYLDRPTPFIHIDTGRHRTWQSGQSRLDDQDDVTELTPNFK